ncbi:XisI protein [Leptolyngbya boryana CZ1]|uniref:XisI protein n=1 Tax=Leptolyngbya boryana CZ1 TaxID=3060204 RepID=A0AA96WX12_LEPBY|nr:MULTISPECIES: XisI protein [Leptolyngbya]MBD1854456.1 XisI protein [Leptolyngbya sp. FACHB-1624]MBN8562377.1 XisI protein [Leptolyngbya sp. UWPOB_LEPTO1]WNZ45739.1 XisI protein [Leptolyngbya boryana CZ1]
MDKLIEYRKIIQQILTSYQNLTPHSPDDEVESLLAFDEVRDQYLWLRSGWQNKNRVRHITMYLRIKNDKVWVEEDWTDLCVVDDLLAAGIPATDIVLGFQPPDVRQYTDFAIA